MALFSAPVAPLGVTPGAVATFLLVASSPLAAMAAWVPTRCLTASLRVRFLVSLAWALSPALLMSAAHGVLAGTLAHVALPILAAYCVSAAAPYGRQCLRCRGRADQSTRRERRAARVWPSSSWPAVPYGLCP